MNWVGLYTIIQRENLRTIKIINQVIWPPIVSSLLYILIFGLSLGKNFDVGDVTYLAFLAPGLIIMNVIMTAYEESSSSLFLGKFINYIQELLIKFLVLSFAIIFPSLIIHVVLHSFSTLSI